MPEPDDTYAIESTSLDSARVDDIVLSETDTGVARKVLRVEIVNNRRDPDCPIKFAVVHQRRRAGEEWSDLEGPSLGNTKAGEATKMLLGTTETRRLFDHLATLYNDYAEKGLRYGRVLLTPADEAEVIRTDATRASLIRQLIGQDHGPEVWQLLVDLQPDLAGRLTVAHVYQQRKAVLDTFEANIGGAQSESFWQDLLENNPWIFGGANLRVISERRLDLGHQMDIPFEVEGGFLEIVELKRPDLAFWSGAKYRGKFLVPYPELEGAIAQLTEYLTRAEAKLTDADFHATHGGVRPLKPKGTVVHGRSNEWGDEEWRAFRLLNDRLHGIQVITFDHLLSSARRAVEILENLSSR